MRAALRLAPGPRCARALSGSATARPAQILSGIQPTGVFTIGNILGAVDNWAALQAASESRCLFMVADLHAMTMPYDPALLPHRCRVQAASIMACGVSEEKSAIFRQSAIREHTELNWALGAITPLPWLQRMTQFKDKSKAVKGTRKGAGGAAPMLKRSSEAGLGLLAYPVLQAADILVYQATAVPVGDDQRQHLELTRDVALAFNSLFCGGSGAATGSGPSGFSLTVPEPIYPPGNTARIMSLRDGRKKMSKSDPSPMSRIDITDSPDTVRAKLRRAKTDALPGLVYDKETRPERTNLLDIFSGVTGRPVADLVGEFESRDSLQFKEALAEAVVAYLSPMQAAMRELLGVEDLEALATGLREGDAAAVSGQLTDTAKIDGVLERGEEFARERAQSTMESVRAVLGLAR